MLRDDIGMRNAILRKRFMCELAILKKMSHCSSCDKSSLNDFLQTLDQAFCAYDAQLWRGQEDPPTLVQGVALDGMRNHQFHSPAAHL
ncbi:hypothetical protein DAPPUDRAFT_247971 [Daphnia pulex]|uniref:Uncharacterized protein n=1 Tax=Daphnia pulex TaxID=6669 RepID=E9GTG0_DAPPU|nr:hypothetical protein DAPPUDRAFT_247971 [Daphnia pulex]|eukprot:EFX77224.1 hypothetical protein DAPPUDRAFT_247971 [Daphnia pulex]